MASRTCDNLENKIGLLKAYRIYQQHTIRELSSVYSVGVACSVSE